MRFNECFLRVREGTGTKNLSELAEIVKVSQPAVSKRKRILFRQSGHF